MAGALDGLKIVEVAGIGPGPFAAMMLADHGAEVVRVEHPRSAEAPPAIDITTRSRRRVLLDLKSLTDAAEFRKLVGTADGLIEGFRPGVMERLGLGPDCLLQDNPRLVYGRLTGWGQEGPLAQAAGHDIDYIALSGNLHGYGRHGEKPTPPINAVGDFGGGGMLMAFGMLAAIHSARTTGLGQVIDCAMIDGAALIHASIWSYRARGTWQDERGVNLLDTGAPCYDVYETADGRFLAVGALEQPFWIALRDKLGLDGADFAQNRDPAQWPVQREALARLLMSRTRDEWCSLLDGTDACVAPVLSMAEAPEHPHNRARSTFIEVDGIVQPAPAPRFSRTPAPPPPSSLPR